MNVGIISICSSYLIFNYIKQNIPNQGGFMTIISLCLIILMIKTQSIAYLLFLPFYLYFQSFVQETILYLVLRYYN